jgi:hypothetical protein
LDLDQNGSTGRKQAFDSSPSWVLYESTDCTGTAYLEFDKQKKSELPVAVVGGQTVYTPDPSGTPKMLTTRSGASQGAACAPFETRNLVAPAIPAIDLATQFTGPFKVEPAK